MIILILLRVLFISGARYHTILKEVAFLRPKDLVVTENEGVILTFEMVIDNTYMQFKSANPIPPILALRDYQEKFN